MQGAKELTKTSKKPAKDMTYLGIYHGSPRIACIVNRGYFTESTGQSNQRAPRSDCGGVHGPWSMVSLVVSPWCSLFPKSA